MPGAARFLYGLALGVSLGIIGSKLIAAALPGARRAGPNGRRPAVKRTPAEVAPR